MAEAEVKDKSEEEEKEKRSRWTKGKGIIYFGNLLLEPRSLEEMGNYLGLSGRGIYRYLRTLKNAFVRIFHIDMDRWKIAEAKGKGKPKVRYCFFPKPVRRITIEYVYENSGDDSPERVQGTVEYVDGEVAELGLLTIFPYSS